MQGHQLSVTTMDYDPQSPEARQAMSQPVGTLTVRPSPTNPRKTFDADKHAEMVESVRKLGVLQPIVVRPWPVDYPWTGDMPYYELVAGERRWRAARDAGLQLIPATVRHLTNEEVLEIQVIENLHRDDLDALEEAEGFNAMMTTCGYTAEQLADKIGKSRGYIYGRLKLCGLGNAARDAFRAGDLEKSVALLIARLPATLQDEALREVLQDEMNHRVAAEHIRTHYMLDLREAPFPPDTLTLVHGDCSTCPKRTGNQPDLYRDVRSADIFTDPTCYQAKRTYNLEQLASQARAAGRKVASDEDAAKILPYNSGNTIHTYKRLDEQNWYAGAWRPVAEIVTDPADILLVPHALTGKLVVKASTVGEYCARHVAAELEAAKENAATSKPATVDIRAAQAKAEAQYRAALFKRIDGQMLEFMGRDSMPLPLLLEDRRLIARQFWARLGCSAQERLAQHLLPDGSYASNSARIAAIKVESMDTGELVRFMNLCALAGMLDVPFYAATFETPSQLLDCARRYGLDPAAIKADQEDKKPKTGAKSAKKSASIPDQAALALEAEGASQAETTPPAEQAAPAPGAEAAEGVKEAATAARHEKPKKSGRASPARGKDKTIQPDLLTSTETTAAANAAA